MKTWKQLISLLLCLCMLVGFFPQMTLHGFAEGEETALVELEPDPAEEETEETPDSASPEEDTQLPEVPQEEIPEATEEEIPEESEGRMEDSEDPVDGVWDMPIITFPETNRSLAVREEISFVAEYRSAQEPKNIQWVCSPSGGVRFSATTVGTPAHRVDGKENTWLLNVTITGVKAGSYDVTAVVNGYTSAPVRLLVKDPDSRYTVLILDASSSMSGTPAAEQRKAAKKFCETLLNSRGDNKIAVVKLAQTSSVGYNFTNDLNALLQYIDRFPENSSTNTNEALEVAWDLLKGLPTGKGISTNVVICSDGLPQTGTTTKNGPYTSSDSSSYYSYANACYNTAAAMKLKNVKIYSLGFFHSVGSSTLAFAKRFMSDLASVGCYYNVERGSDLEFLFEQIAGEIIVQPPEVKISEIKLLSETADTAVYRIRVTVTNKVETQALDLLSVNLDEGSNAQIIRGSKKQEVGTLGANSSTEVVWEISIDRAGYPDGGAHEFYVSAVSNQTVSASTKGSIGIGSANELSNELDFSKDVWNFHNFSEELVDENGPDDGPRVPHPMSSQDKNNFLVDAVPSERAEIERILISNGTNGHCFGMSLTAILNKLHIFDISLYSNAKNLRSAKLTDRIWSILCYYQLLQYYDYFSADQQEFTAKPTAQKLALLAERAGKVKEGGAPVLMSFGADNWGGHAVVAYAVEPGSWTVEGVTYDHRILIYDSNVSLDKWSPINTVWDENYCLYYREGTDQWVIPAYRDHSAAKNRIGSMNPTAKLTRACNDPLILNDGNYAANNYRFRAECTTNAETALRMTDGSREYVFGGEAGTAGVNSILVTYYSADYDPENGRISNLNIVLPDEMEEYTISPASGKSEELELGIKYSDKYLSIDSENAEGAVFSGTGSLELIGNSGEFAMTVADDAIPAGEFNTYTVRGSTEGDVAIYVSEEGMKITGDNLKGLTIVASEGDVFDTVIIDAETTEVDVRRSEDELIVVQDEERSPISLEQQYLAMTVGEKHTLKVNISSIEEAGEIAWSVKKITGDAVTVKNGVVTAKAAGTAEVTASVTIGGKPYSARCRVDVLAKGDSVAAEVEVNGVTLVDSQATVELFRTDYTRVIFLPNLKQNMMAQAQDDGMANTGHAVQAARFADSAAADKFTLRVVDDRTLEIIPTQSALDEPASVDNVKSPVILTVDGKEFTTQPLSLTVKKTLPSVKVKAVKLNSFDRKPGALVFSGANVLSVEAAGALPAGFRVDGLNVVYGGSAPKASAKLNLLAEVEGLSKKVPVTVSVSVSRTEPAVKLSASSVSLLAGSMDQAAVTVTGTGSLDVTVVDNRNTVTDAIRWSLEEGVLTFFAPDQSAAGKTFKCTVNVHGSSKKAALTIKVPNAKPAMTLKVSGAIDFGIPNSPVTVTPKITNYHVGSGEQYYLRVTQSGTGMDVSRMFAMTEENGVLTITAISALPSGFTYEAFVGTALDDYRMFRYEKSFKLPVKWTDPAKVSVSASLKASGSIDVIRPATSLTLTPVFKNVYGFQPSVNDLVFYKNKTAIIGKVPFNVTVENGCYVLTNNGADSSAKYTVSLKANVNGRTITSAPVSLPVKMGTVKAVTNVKSVTLLRGDRYDSRTIQIVLPEDVAAVDHLGQDGVSAKLYTVTDLGGSVYRIAFNDRIPASKGATVRLNIYLKGNLTNKPNASVSLKVNQK